MWFAIYGISVMFKEVKVSYLKGDLYMWQKCNAQNTDTNYVAKQHINSKSASGYTLLEVTAAMVLLAGTILGVIGVFTYAFRTNEISQTQTISYKAAQDVMEQIMAMDYGTLTAQNGVQFDVIGLDKVPPPNSLGLVTVTDVTPTPPPGKLYQITVSVNYAGGNGVPRINVNLVTMRAKP